MDLLSVVKYNPLMLTYETNQLQGLSQERSTVTQIIHWIPSVRGGIQHFQCV
jgi:hypothetical protein